MNYIEIEVEVGTEFMSQTYPSPGIYRLKQVAGIWNDWVFIVSNNKTVMSLGLINDYSFLTGDTSSPSGSLNSDKKTVREDFALKMLSVVLRDNMKFKEIE